MSGWNEAMAAYMQGESGNADNWLADKYAALQDNTHVPYSEANAWGWLGNLSRIPKPPKQNIPMPKMPVSDVYKAIRTTLAPFGIQAIIHGAKETKKMAEDEINEIARQITYPENLINETAGRYLSKARK